MKRSNILIFLSFVFSILITSCLDLNTDNPLPDLDPDTPEGGTITIFEINDVITFLSERGPDLVLEQFENIYREYDLANDGVIDFTLTGTNESGLVNFESALYLRFNGQALSNQGSEFGQAYAYTQFVPEGVLVAGSAIGVWANAGKALEFVRDVDAISTPFYIASTFPKGISYMPTRTQVGSDYFYGWLEVIASDLDDTDINEFVVISRFGISQTPGLRIRMGQE